MVLAKTLGYHKAKEIWARIDRHLDLWEGGIHADLVGDAIVEVRAREVRVEKRK